MHFLKFFQKFEVFVEHILKFKFALHNNKYNWITSEEACTSTSYISSPYVLQIKVKKHLKQRNFLYSKIQNKSMWERNKRCINLEFISDLIQHWATVYRHPIHILSVDWFSIAVKISKNGSSVILEIQLQKCVVYAGVVQNVQFLKFTVTIKMITFWKHAFNF